MSNKQSLELSNLICNTAPTPGKVDGSGMDTLLPGPSKCCICFELSTCQTISKFLWCWVFIKVFLLSKCFFFKMLSGSGVCRYPVVSTRQSEAKKEGSHWVHTVCEKPFLGTRMTPITHGNSTATWTRGVMIAAFLAVRVPLKKRWENLRGMSCDSDVEEVPLTTVLRHPASCLLWVGIRFYVHWLNCNMPWWSLYIIWYYIFELYVLSFWHVDALELLPCKIA